MRRSDALNRAAASPVGRRMNLDDPPPNAKSHRCLGGERSYAPSRWLYDGNGIPLCRACDQCEEHHLAKYNPAVLKPYDQNAVDEAIEDPT